MEENLKPLFTNKQLFRLLWPLVVEQLLTVFVGMVDVLMVAAVGEAAVSGVSLVDAINNLIIQILFALTAAGTIVCAQFIGSGDNPRAGRTTAQLIVITVIGTSLVTLVFLLGGEWLLSIIFGKVETSVMNNAHIYMVLTSCSFPFLALYYSGAAAFRASGNTKIAMLMSLLMNGINIIGNMICIFGLKMGVSGVAIPTVIARVIAAILIIKLFQSKKNQTRIEKVADFKPQTAIIRKILFIGIPNGIESGMFQFGKLTLQSLVSTLGTASIAGFAVASNLVTYLYLPGNALGTGMMTIIGQCYGANQPKQAKKYAKKLIVLNYIMLIFLCTIMIVGRGFFVGAYHLSQDASYLAKGLIFIHSVAMIIWPMAFLTPYYFRAIGKATFTMVIAIFSMWVFRIGLAYVLIKGLDMNVLGVWYAMFVDWIFRTIVYMVGFGREKLS